MAYRFLYNNKKEGYTKASMWNDSKKKSVLLGLRYRGNVPKSEISFVWLKATDVRMLVVKGGTQCPYTFFLTREG